MERINKTEPRMQRVIVLMVAGLLCAVPPLAARDADPGFLPPSEMYDPAHFLPPPPAEGSPKALAELAETKKLLAEATPAMRAAAALDDGNENGTIFAVVLGPAWDLAKLPATAKLIHEVTASEGPFSGIAKTEFHRKRPWVVDPSIQTCAPHRPSQDMQSYPSGHTTVGYGMGVVLANLMPSHAQAILGRSAQFAENRIICGMHFRSDIVAGQQFGTIMAIRLMQNPQFQSDMAAAKTELQAAHLAP
jgi:acid phosphatase (class A)